MSFRKFAIKIVRSSGNDFSVKPYNGSDSGTLMCTGPPP